MKIKKLQENVVTGEEVYATLHNKQENVSLSLNNTYTFTHQGVGENIIILYTGSIEITNITVDGNTILNTSIPVTSNPVILPIDWNSSISITIQATATANIFILYSGT